MTGCARHLNVDGNSNRSDKLKRALTSHSSDAHMERAFATMTDMGFLEADDQRAELRLAKPMRDLTAQHATFLLGAADLALAGDDKHAGRHRVLSETELEDATIVAA
jgi:hypothetical protein